MQKSRRDKRQHKPLAERMRDAAEVGDPRGVIDAFENDPINPQDYWLQFQESIRRALKKAARDSPISTLEFLLQEMLVFDGLLMLRCHSIANQELGWVDENAPQNKGNMPEHLANEWLPRIQRIHEEIRLTCSVFAKAMHTMQLAQSKSQASGLIPFDSKITEDGATDDGDAAAAQS